MLDVCSVKEEPQQLMLDHLPDHVDIVGTHPLFGPQTGADGIADLRVPCATYGDRLACVDAFLSESLKLKTIITTAEEHDRQHYVQGLTHLISKIVVEMDMPNWITQRNLRHHAQMIDPCATIRRTVPGHRKPEPVVTTREEFFDAAVSLRNGWQSRHREMTDTSGHQQYALDDDLSDADLNLCTHVILDELGDEGQIKLINSRLP